MRYQDACRKQLLRMGTPFLYKRESSFHEELADDPGSLPKATWFLLFATKEHWRQDADLSSIDQGLTWILGNFDSEASLRSRCQLWVADLAT